MKKFISSLCLAILFAMVFVSVGCDSSEWKEVQSITYTTESGSTALYSKLCWDLTIEEIEKSEYDEAPKEYKPDDESIPYEYIWQSKEMNIGIDNRNELIAEAETKVGNTYYGYYYINYGQPPVYYQKVTFISYNIHYVKIRFLKDNSMEINYNDKVIKILPLSYEVTYFTN